MLPKGSCGVKPKLSRLSSLFRRFWARKVPSGRASPAVARPTRALARQSAAVANQAPGRTPSIRQHVFIVGHLINAGQALAARGGLDPEAELAGFDGLRVQVHAVKIVLENLPVEVEEGALAAEFLQPGVGESDVQAGVAFVNGAEQAAEVVPERVRVVRIAVLEGVLEGFGGQ
jgi:hypothetical protein